MNVANDRIPVAAIAIVKISNEDARD